jgi:hypothetical protein
MRPMQDHLAHASSRFFRLLFGRIEDATHFNEIMLFDPSRLSAGGSPDVLRGTATLGRDRTLCASPDPENRGGVTTTTTCGLIDPFANVSKNPSPLAGVQTAAANVTMDSPLAERELFHEMGNKGVSDFGCGRLG